MVQTFEWREDYTEFKDRRLAEASKPLGPFLPDFKASLFFLNVHVEL